MTPIFFSAGGLEADITSGGAVALATGLTNTGAPGEHLYVFGSSVDAWILQSNAGTAATAGPGSYFVPGGTLITLDGLSGSHVSCLADDASGHASLVPIQFPR